MTVYRRPRVVPVTSMATAWSCPHHHLQDRRDPCNEAKDDVTLEALSLLARSLSHVTCTFP
jgi:hypothetical protein